MKVSTIIPTIIHFYNSFFLFRIVEMVDDSLSVSGFLSDFVIVNGLSTLHELLHAKCKKASVTSLSVPSTEYVSCYAVNQLTITMRFLGKEP